MYLIRLLMVLCWSWSALISAEVDESLASDLSTMMNRLTHAQTEVLSSSAGVGVEVPHGLADVLLVRRTIAADWQRRLTEGIVQAKDPALVRFIGEQRVFISALEQLVQLIDQLKSSPERYPQSQKEAAFTRYRAFLLDAIHQRLSALAGRQSAQPEPDWRERESRHTELLSQIESDHTCAERYATLPPDDRQLAAYRELMAQARTALEQAIDNVGKSDNQQGYSYQAILSAYAEVLDMRVQTLQELADSGLEATAPEVKTLHRAAEAFMQILDKRLAVVHRDAGYPAPVSTGMDEEDVKHMDEQARVALLAQCDENRAKRLLTMASQWLSSESRCRTQLKAYAEEIASAPPSFIKAKRKVMDDFSDQQRAAQTDFDRAVTAADESAALTAQQTRERIDQHRIRHLENVDMEMDLAERESVWRARIKDPAVAEKLREWDKHRAAALAAQLAIEEAEDAALAAKHAVERAQWLASQAEERAQIVQQNAQRHLDLYEWMNALDELVEQSEIVQ